MEILGVAWHLLIVQIQPKWIGRGSALRMNVRLLDVPRHRPLSGPLIHIVLLHEHSATNDSMLGTALY